MSIPAQISTYLSSIPEPKRAEMEDLHERILQLSPGCRLWYYDGTDKDGKIVANPAIGYGAYTIQYANGKTMEWFRIGLSAVKTGISVYVMGLPDKTYLATTYGKSIGKAKITGYCIGFKTVKDIDVAVLQEAVTYALQLS